MTDTQELEARLRTAASNKRVHAARGEDAGWHKLDEAQKVGCLATAEMHEEAAGTIASLRAKAAQAEKLAEAARLVIDSAEKWGEAEDGSAKEAEWMYALQSDISSLRSALTEKPNG